MREKIIRLLELNGTISHVKNYMSGFIDSLNQELGGNLKLIDSDFDLMIEASVPIYQKYYTEEQIDGLIDFFSSDLGKSLREKIPLIQQETFSLGEQISHIILQRLESQNDDSNVRQLYT